MGHQTAIGMVHGRRKRDLGLAMACSATVAALLLSGSTARASCVAPVREIVWSYPADGEKNVPTNARVFLLTTYGAFEPGTIAINGQPLSREPGDSRAGLGPALAPLTEYVVTLSQASSSEPTLSFRFETGMGPVAAPLPAVPVVERQTRLTVRAFSPMCAAAWHAMDCFDTGQDTHLVFETASRPLLFYVEPLASGLLPWSMAWPGVCGDPEVFIRSGGPPCTGPFRLHAVSLTGDETTADPQCTAAPGGVPPMGSGCAVAGGPPDRCFMIFVGAVVWAALGRRRRSPRSGPGQSPTMSTD
jgi:hypothetical protein